MMITNFGAVASTQVSFLDTNTKLSAPYPSDLVMYTGFTNATTAVDYGSYTLSKSGGGFETGYFDSGLRFNNGNGYAAWNATVIPFGNKTLRFKFKVYGPAQVSWGGLLLSTSTGGSNRSGLTIGLSGATTNPCSVGVGIFASSELSATFTNMVYYNTWYDFVMTYEAGTTNLRAWLNGVESTKYVRLAAERTNGNVNVLQTGAEGPYSDNAYNGVIDEIEVYNTIKVV